MILFIFSELEMKLQANRVHRWIDGYRESNAFRVGENRESNPPLKTAECPAIQTQMERCSLLGNVVIIGCKLSLLVQFPDQLDIKVLDSDNVPNDNRMFP